MRIVLLRATVPTVVITLNFLLTSLVVVLIPGTGVLFTISTGLRLGRRASVFAALGCTAGIVPHLLATVCGLAALLHASALAFQTVKLAGVAYLLYLAWATWRETGTFAVDQPFAATRPGALVLKAFLLNILNPKLSLFFLAFLPQFIRHDTPSALGQMLALSGVFMLMTFAVFTIYGQLAHGFRRAAIDSPRIQAWLRRGFAAGFVALGLDLAFADR